MNMKKTIRLTETDLIKVIKRIINEQTESLCTEEQFNSSNKKFDDILKYAGIGDSEIRSIKEKINSVGTIDQLKPTNMSQKQINAIKKIFNRLSRMTEEQLKNALKELKGIRDKYTQPTPGYDQPTQTSQPPITERVVDPLVIIIGVGVTAAILSGPFIGFLIVGAALLLYNIIFPGPCAPRGRKRGTFRRRR